MGGLLSSTLELKRLFEVEVEFAEFSSKEDEMLKFGEMNNLAMAIEIRARKGLIYIPDCTKNC